MDTICSLADVFGYDCPTAEYTLSCTASSIFIIPTSVEFLSHYIVLSHLSQATRYSVLGTETFFDINKEIRVSGAFKMLAFVIVIILHTTNRKVYMTGYILTKFSSLKTVKEYLINGSNSTYLTTDSPYKNWDLVLKTEQPKVKQTIHQFNKVAYHEIHKFSYRNYLNTKLNNDEPIWKYGGIYLRPVNKTLNLWNSNEHSNSQSVVLSNITSLPNRGKRHIDEELNNSRKVLLPFKDIKNNSGHKFNQQKNTLLIEKHYKYNEINRERPSVNHFHVTGSKQIPSQSEQNHLTTDSKAASRKDYNKKYLTENGYVDGKLEQNSNLLSKVITVHVQRSCDQNLGFAVNEANLINMDLKKSVELLRLAQSPVHLKIKRLDKIDSLIDANCKAVSLSIDTDIDTDMETEMITKIIEVIPNYISTKCTKIKEHSEAENTQNINLCETVLNSTDNNKTNKEITTKSAMRNEYAKLLRRKVMKWLHVHHAFIQGVKFGTRQPDKDALKCSQIMAKTISEIIVDDDQIASDDYYASEENEEAIDGVDEDLSKDCRVSNINAREQS
ncbi:hypothetical protein MN116_001610 [Schistosoma mekongi]|uniref:Uncharacterized protein n=1 Tax=Schistosoma mekongi TaxID=38744 RepID=A0AAE1ZHM0_SCHME|nr:hypothetical protein MN116_001610 [Schistosoma mekongi]